MIRPASTVLALRPDPAGFQVLMVRRASHSVFMGGAFVFPGGAIDAADRGEDAAAAVAGVNGAELAWRAAGLRELAEEAGVFVTEPPADPGDADRWAGLEGAALYRALAGSGHAFAAGALAYLSNWVTPSGPPRRFDTRFYLAPVAAGTAARPDGVEVTEAVWASPAAALERAARGEWHVPFPTMRHLELLAQFASVEDAFDFAASQPEVPRVAPRVVGTREDFRILMPGEPGYEEAPV